VNEDDNKPITKKLLGHLQRAGIDATAVRNEDSTPSQDELVLFFQDDKFLIRVDPRTPTVWLKGTHSEENT
jgi:hypothetical protein